MPPTPSATGKGLLADGLSAAVTMLCDSAGMYMFALPWMRTVMSEAELRLTVPLVALG
jgi:hypothetical protein